MAAEEQSAPGPDGFTDAAAAERDHRDGEGEAAPPALAPALVWRPAQLASDLALAKELMAAVDKEKGIAANPLVPAAAAAAQPAAVAEAEGGEGQPGGEEPTAAAAEGEQQAEQQAEEMDAELSPEEAQEKLDQVGGCGW